MGNALNPGQAKIYYTIPGTRVFDPNGKIFYEGVHPIRTGFLSFSFDMGPKTQVTFSNTVSDKTITFLNADAKKTINNIVRLNENYNVIKVKRFESFEINHIWYNNIFSNIYVLTLLLILIYCVYKSLIKYY